MFLFKLQKSTFYYYNLQSEMKVKVHVNHFTASWYSPVNFVLTFFTIACTRLFKYMDVSCLKEKYIYSQSLILVNQMMLLHVNCNIPQKDNQHFFFICCANHTWIIIQSNGKQNESVLKIWKALTLQLIIHVKLLTRYEVIQFRVPETNYLWKYFFFI